MKAFSEKEKEYYAQRLMDSGREIFARYGVRKTTIDDLTKAAGIAKGSFYTFFESKEDLFFSILTKEVQKSREETIQKISSLYDDPYMMVKIFLQSVLDSIEANLILRITLSDEGHELMARESILKEMKYNGDITAGLEGVISRWMEKGIIPRRDTKAATNLIKTLFIVSANKDKLNEACYQETMGMLVNFIARGLTTD